MEKKLYLKTNGFKGASEPYHYIFAANGTFLAKENVAFKAIVKVDATKELRLVPQEQMFVWKLPKIPFRIVQRGVNFLRWAYTEKRSEALLLIDYKPSEKAFELYAPVQSVSCGSVRSDEHKPTPEGLINVGTMHGHPREAFHSSTDQQDEAGLDGLHITVGNLDQVIPEFDVELVVKGHRFAMKPEDVMDYEFCVPGDWMEKVQARNVFMNRILGR